MSFGLALRSSPGTLVGGALDMDSFPFLVGFVLFQTAKFLSNRYLSVVVLKVIRASASNCLPPGLGLKMLIFPAFGSVVWSLMMSFISSSCCLLSRFLKSCLSSDTIVLMLCILS